ncbi:MAG TPA: DUF2085 domain-containing protein [Terriglobales bacterium]|nr:DUF2085 domain-containing protein [Terriglobales bacterium]
MDFLSHLFSHFCGQVNCWHAAGVTSVACQRCTGLYIGTLFSAALFFIFRPRPNSLSLWLHGLAMLVIVPFGYHLVRHGGAVRAITGQLFGYGMAYYLLLIPADRFDLWRPSGASLSRHLLSRAWGRSLYTMSLLAQIPLVLVIATLGSAFAIIVLSFLSFAGLMTITYLIAWNALILGTMGWTRLRERIFTAS